MIAVNNKNKQKQKEIKDKKAKQNQEIDNKDFAINDDLEKLKKENESLLEKNSRLLADYQNLERRFLKEKEQLARLANLGFVQSILDDLDHIKMAEDNLKNKDLTMVMNKFRETLKNLGLEEIQAKGKEFDPNLMEVVKKEGEGDKVLQVIQRGFTLNGQVIRVAKVIVG